jgi:hypothetical protein
MLSFTLWLALAAQDEAAKKAVEDFKAKIKDVKAAVERAALVKEFGEAEPLDPVKVPSIAKYLAPGANDPTYLLPVVAIDCLARYRGSAAASQVLMGALQGYKKIPYLQSRVIPAIGKVGHESALPFFEEWLKGKDADQAVHGVRAIEGFPAPVALEKFFAQYDAIEKKKDNVSPEQKAVNDRLQPEILKAVKRISEQPYPTMKELLIWYQKRGKEEAAKKAAEYKPEAARPGLPVPLLVEFGFRENGGAQAANSGTTGALFATAAIAPGGKPAWTGTVPPNAGPSALDWGPGGAGAVDLGGGAGLEQLKNLKSFTISGWTISTEPKEGPSSKEAGAGNRIVSWFHPIKLLEGVELVHRADGSLQLGVNQWAEQSPAKSPIEQIPVYDAKAKEAGGEQYRTWRFFAVTYDSTEVLLRHAQRRRQAGGEGRRLPPRRLRREDRPPPHGRERLPPRPPDGPRARLPRHPGRDPHLGQLPRRLRSAPAPRTGQGPEQGRAGPLKKGRLGPRPRVE